jgi:plastocyanin
VSGVLPRRSKTTCRHLLQALAAGAVLLATALAWPVRSAGLVHETAIKDLAFAPAQVTVHVGDTVVWTNADIVAHTATSGQGGFDVDIPSGGRGRAIMTRAGTFNYICRYHPNMRGQIISKS